MTEWLLNHTPGQVVPYSVPLETLDVSNPYLSAADVHHPWFIRLRDEAPVPVVAHARG